MPSIVVLRLSSLGDLILTTSLLTALRERYPESRIDLVTSCDYESLGPLIPAVTNIYYFDRKTGFAGLLKFRRMLKARRYDVVLDLHNSLRTRILRQTLAPTISVVDKRTIKRWMLVRYKYDQLKSAPDVVGRYFETATGLDIRDDGRGPRLIAETTAPPSRTIGLAPGAKHWNKRWPIEYYIELARQLSAQGYRIALFGSTPETVIADEVLRETQSLGTVTSYIGELSLSETARRISGMACMVTNDSGLMHMSNALGVPTVSFFGPTVREFGFAPRSANAIVLEVEDLYCRPCTAIGLETCPQKHFRCMRELTPSMTLVQIERSLH